MLAGRLEHSDDSIDPYGLYQHLKLDHRFSLVSHVFLLHVIVIDSLDHRGSLTLSFILYRQAHMQALVLQLQIRRESWGSLTQKPRSLY